jgi:GT2 family glycosyltransferase
MKPIFSVIIPSYRRPKELAGCLNAFRRIHYPKEDFEVIVVDDGSVPPLDRVIRPFSGSFELILLLKKNGGPASARNAGASHARGKFLAFTDDDCVPDRDWLYSLGKRLEVNGDCAVGGRTLNGIPGNPFSSASQVLMDCLYAHFNRDPDRARFFASNNLALPAQVFKKIGGFDTAFRRAAGEDRNLCERLRFMGTEMVFAPEAVVSHRHGMNFEGFLKQNRNYGRGSFLFHQRRTQERRVFFPDEGLRFYLELMLYPFFSGKVKRRILTGALFLISQMAVAVGFLEEWRLESRKNGRIEVNGG